jgi:hypothetical protein
VVVLRFFLPRGRPQVVLASWPVVLALALASCWVEVGLGFD